MAIKLEEDSKELELFDCKTKPWVPCWKVGEDIPGKARAKIWCSETKIIMRNFPDDNKLLLKSNTYLLHNGILPAIHTLEGENSTSL